MVVTSDIIRYRSDNGIADTGERCDFYGYANFPDRYVQFLRDDQDRKPILKIQDETDRYRAISCEVDIGRQFKLAMIYIHEHKYTSMLRMKGT